MSVSVSGPGVTPVESSVSAVSWASVFAGAVAATAITLVLLLIGSGLGLTMVSPWSGGSSSATTIGVTAAIWLIVVQWLSAGLGGYITGRLRTKWVGVHTDEVYFRDSAHGFLSWAVGTILVAGLLSSAVSSIVGTTAQTAGLAVGATGAAAVSAASDASPGLSTSYFTDALLRPANPATPPAGQTDEAATGQVSRILLSSAAEGQMSDDDKAYLGQLVAAKTGLSEADAKARVDTVVARINDAKTAAQQAADTARKTAATTALLGALSLLIGAFIAAVTATIAGRQRDEEPDLILS